MDAVEGYSKPSQGVFRFIPDAWVPYAELMRLDRPSGFWAFYWHYLIGLGFAINVQPFSSNLDLVSVGLLAAYLGLWTTVFRGITCTWNDNLDQDFDRQVARCRVRPIPRGAVTTMQAHFFTAVLVAAGAFILYPYGHSILYHAAVDSVLLFIYPLLKRCTDFPQVELGFGLSYAIFLVAASVGKDPLAPLLDSSLTLSARVSRVVESPLAQSAACLYVAGILWSVIFDTIYAHQDYLDDLKAGVNGLAVRLGRKGTKPACYVMGAVQIYCLVLAGHLAEFGLSYYAISCGATALMLARMIWVTDLEDGASCAWAFGRGSAYVGASISAGLLTEFWTRKHGY
ncbi:para-hydroxybenzoate-polyprenyltransferase [Viridothelium virens]|uniref:Para-hydroxybenzoate-polyprenyltransferase n=1 Tax=Viridothelium virens TaxID=1048519 RepID=A0A6A6GTB1_VIRVR|nr:para-hydroxybenzoate-polyprenyltransferase [Viridothelium virens]